MGTMEGRKFITYNIPDAFLQADWPEDNNYYLNFEGLMVKMICEIDKKYVLINKTINYAVSLLLLFVLLLLYRMTCGYRIETINRVHYNNTM